MCLSEHVRLLQLERLMCDVDLCNALEDMTETEKESEILPITVQQIHVLSRLGKTDEVEELANRLKHAEYVI